MFGPRPERKGTDKVTELFCDTGTLPCLPEYFLNQHVRVPLRGWARGQVLSVTILLTLSSSLVLWIILLVWKMSWFWDATGISPRSHGCRLRGRREAEQTVHSPAHHTVYGVARKQRKSWKPQKWISRMHSCPSILDVYKHSNGY